VCDIDSETKKLRIVAAGTCTVTASQGGNENFHVAQAVERTFTIGAAATATTVQVRPNPQQYSDLVTLNATVSGPGTPSGTVQFRIDGVNVGGPQPLSGGSASLSNYQVTQPPGAYSVTAVFTSNSSNWSNSTSAAQTLIVKQEDALAEYTGSLFVSTGGASTSKATDNVAATVRDITAVTETDPNFGDIRKATIQFVLNDMGGVQKGSCSATIGLVNAADTKTGTATCSIPVDIGTQESIPYTVDMKIGGHYVAPPNPQVVTVSKVINGMITGGGYLVNSASARGS
jgi:hypothetical protein